MSVNILYRVDLGFQYLYQERNPIILVIGAAVLNVYICAMQVGLTNPFIHECRSSDRGCYGMCCTSCLWVERGKLLLFLIHKI